ncbi:peptidoglycan -binding protein [Alkalilimnicola sp. S0819]|uniref:peptidoglycan -binding protein n=1 Tax=Alkalilimnicola sp. S0819 TaxID=2613922 RepID=UPI001261E4D4|nr:peptidoglycan -binding protein [Alkalilimnicola sp. S0819]KAB7627293.1 peptidoglycan -binding protein [Alkalilimnicola sp. S0819]MPQ16007.1 peptidoglycan -binding protein [Alkalilimnicola sp. S0819]
MLGTGRRVRYGLNIWPGFVDALATLLLVFVFMLSLFMAAQYYMSEALSGRNATIAQLRLEVEQLARTLSLEREARDGLEQELTALGEELRASLARGEELEASLEQARGRLAARDQRLAEQARAVASLEQDVTSLRGTREELRQALGESRDELDAARVRGTALETQLADTEQRLARVRREADEEVARLSRQVAALRQQLQEVAAALELSEQTVAEQRTEIRDLGQRLNTALAQKVQELQDYRSEFFGRLRRVLGDHPDIRIVGDRFLFQSELLFDSASARLEPAGREQLRRVAGTLMGLSEEIPAEIPWVLQVEGHTDRRPINTPEFPSNWELSTARANSIVHFLIAEGIPPSRLAAAGFGEYHPVAEGDSAADLRRNRRIELRLTRR